ncbi:MAG: acyl-CoA reductase [Bacteroidia bacterium]
MASYPHSLFELQEPLVLWGRWFRQAPESSSWSALVSKTSRLNPWFEEAMLRYAVLAWADALSEQGVARWLKEAETFHKDRPLGKDIGLVLAGNLPLVGLHDVLCVLVSGHHAQIKLSSDDAGLTPWALDGLLTVFPAFHSAFRLVERVIKPDAVIATGSDSSLPYFEQYFGHLPRLLRGHRNSTAILWGDEEEEDWQGLAQDIFLYYGKGCRNVSRILIPEDYPPARILDKLDGWEWQGENSRYRNNLDYQMALQIIDRRPYLQNGSLVLRQNPDPRSPLGVLHWEKYRSPEGLCDLILPWWPQTQCLVGKNLEKRTSTFGALQQALGEKEYRRFQKQWTPPGQTQKPTLTDYADGVNTLEFLINLGT